MILSRRRFVTSTGIALIGCGLVRPGSVLAGASWAAKLVDESIRLERETGGRLGVGALDTADGTLAGHRLDERFPMCSTFKWLAAAAVLKRVDAGKETLDRRIRYEVSDLVNYSPATKEHAGKSGMTLAELCDAAITLSDNTAGNLLLASLGGPSGLTDFARSIGDDVTRLDRIEPELNEALPGDPRDTTSPRAMTSALRKLVLGDGLSAGSRERLVGWLVGSKVGDKRIRAGLPKDWRVGDKTGTGERGTANDVGVLWPPKRAPIVLSIYLTGATNSPDQRNVTIASVARALVSAVGE